MKVLVTGADGFVGRWLTRHLEAEGDEVHPVHGHSNPAHGLAVDLRDADAVASVVGDVRPEGVYHLAAVTFGPDAARDVDHAIAVNAGGTANLLAACASLATPPTVLVTSSSEVYAPLSERPISESDPILPWNAYGASKLAQEATALAYDRAGRLPVAIVRPFNHIGPGQRTAFVVPSFARQLARIVSGHQEPEVAVGNLTAIRDFSDVRDVVRAYRLLVTRSIHGRPLNVASGQGVRLQDVLDSIVAISGASVAIRIDPNRLRPVDVPSVVGDASALTDLTGWRPQISLRESLQAVWEDALVRYSTEEP